MRLGIMKNMANFCPKIRESDGDGLFNSGGNLIPY